MIKIENGKLTMTGTVPNLLADLGVIISEMIREINVSSEAIDYVVKLAKMSEEDLKAEKKKKIDKELYDLYFGEED